MEFDAVVAPESRGAIFGMPVAYELHKAFIQCEGKENCLEKPLKVVESYTVALIVVCLNPCKKLFRKIMVVFATTSV